jgi:tol-pal system protein YbgF
MEKPSPASMRRGFTKSRTGNMNKLVLAAMLGLAAMGGQASAFSLSDFAPRGTQPQRPVVMVQGAADSVRIQQLEETIRQLNGRVEEMSFQLLQMQEQMRKAQEDNEFRFQELEKSQSGGGSSSHVAAAPAAGSKKNSSDEVARIIESPAPNAAGASGPGTAAPGETTLGSIELDASGMPTRATVNPEARNSSALPGVDTGPSPTPAPPQTAALTNEGDAYRAAYNHVLSGDYQLAESEFNTYIASFPNSSRAPDARFWLGEAQYSQGKYSEAAKTFLDGHQAYANSTKAPEMLLKLGMSLAQLDNRDTACATLREVPRRYPNAARPVLAKVTSEQKRLSC